jgi:AcrR family transcriptional regulator
MAEAVAENGYASTTVADVIKRARASRETFYEHFANKQECFLAAYDECVGTLTALMGDAGTGSVTDDDPVGRFERGLGAYLDAMAANPGLAHTFMIEVYAAGPDVWPRRADVLDRFGDVVHLTLAGDPRFEQLPDPRFAARAIAGVVSSLVTGALAAGDYAELPALREPVTAFVRALLD